MELRSVHHRTPHTKHKRTALIIHPPSQVSTIQKKETVTMLPKPTVATTIPMKAKVKIVQRTLEHRTQNITHSACKEYSRK